MQFLTPLALALGILAIPIAVLYMLRLRRRDTPIASTLLWEQVLRDREANAPWQRLRRNWLLILQLLILLTLIVALARPYLPVPTLAAGRMAVLLDASASMNASDVLPSRFAVARAQALSLIDTLGASDSAAVIRVGAQPQALTAYLSDHDQLRAAINAAQPGTTSADWSAALTLAAAGAIGADNFTIVIIGDGGLPANLPSVPGTLRYIPIGQSDLNVAIGALSVAATSGNPPQLYARLTNYGSQDAPIVFSVTLDGSLFRAQTYTVPAERSLDIVFDKLPATFSHIQAQIARTAASTTPDFLAEDNTAYAVYSPNPAGKALIVMQNANQFLEQGFASLPGWAAYSLSAGATFPVDPYDLYVFDGWLPTALPNAPILIVNPPANSANKMFQVTGTISTPTQGGEVVSDPRTSGLSLKGVHIQRYETIAAPWATILAKASDGGALLFAGDYQGHRVALIPFDLHDSDLPLQIAWPILLSDLANWYQTPAALQQENGFAPGQAVSIHPAPGTDRGEIRRPDNTVSPLTIGQGAVSYAGTDQPGFYEISVYQGTQAIQKETFAVNLFDPLESQIAPAKALTIGSTTTAPGTQALGQKEYWPLLALLALALVTLEWIFYQRSRRSPRRSTMQSADARRRGVVR